MANKLTIQQGATWRRTVYVKNPDKTVVDLTGCTARRQFRANYADSSAPILYEISTAAGGITITALTGKIAEEISATVTAGFTWRAAKSDLEVTFSDGTVRRVTEDDVTVTPEVTRV